MTKTTSIRKREVESFLLLYRSGELTHQSAAGTRETLRAHLAQMPISRAARLLGRTR
jgi:hypothetical protein